MCCRASLYERPVNLESAKKAHSEFRRVMREHGIKVRIFSHPLTQVFILYLPPLSSKRFSFGAQYLTAM